MRLSRSDQVARRSVATEPRSGRKGPREHLDYSKAITGALHGLDPAKVPVGEQVAALEALNTKYTDFINESRKFVDTADITKADAKRDALFMAIYTAVDYLAARRRRACARRRPPSSSRSSLGSTRRRGSFRHIPRAKRAPKEAQCGVRSWRASAVTALMGVISQYRLVASQHTAKREKPEPGPEAAS